MLDNSFPRATPNPNFAISIGSINSIIGDLESKHHTGFGLELPAFRELGQLPHTDGVALRPRVHQPVGGGDAQDLPVLLQHGGDAAVGGGVHHVQLGGEGEPRGRRLGVVEREGDGGGAQPRRDADGVGERRLFGGDAPRESNGVASHVEGWIGRPFA